MRRALILTALILLRLPAIALAAALAWVQTAPGKRQLVQLIETAAASPSLDVRIGRLDGFVPFDLTVVNLAVADGRGVWLTIDRARFAWSPLDLLDRVLHVVLVKADPIRVASTEERRVGQACVSTCRSWWAAYH